MLIPSLGERLEHLRGHARMRAHPGADDRDLADLRVGVDLARSPARHGPGSSARSAARTSSVAIVNDTSASRPSPRGSFWMIVSTLQLASASAAEDRRRGAGTVGNPEQRDPRLLGRVGDGGDQRVLHRLVLSDDNGTGTLLEARAAVDPDAVGPGVLDRAQLQHLGARGRHLEHLLEAHHTAACGRSGTIRGSAVKTPATSV